MDYEKLRELVRERVGVEGVPRIISLAHDGKPIPTVICLVKHEGGRFTATRGDLRTIARPVLNEAGEELTFASEADACAWAWQDLEPGLGVTPTYSPEEERESLASGDRQRARREQRLREWKAASGAISD
ncbi:hypothetical protein [Microbacterium testaceum]|uniref:hypothetical protein n=1 Tax=Microbacterium testaceum TaxID=2033 RepID=UPI002AC37A97|nr:hypothetical protein [Microbacterium testaceum]MDZ5143791.1 hypothetical protein [Microbacterium testaceum]